MIIAKNLAASSRQTWGRSCATVTRWITRRLAFLLMISCSASLFAQNQQLDSLYRSMAEAQAEFNRQAMLREQQRASRVEPVPRSPLAGSTVTQPSVGPQSVPSAQPTASGSALQPNWFQNELWSIANSLKQLLPELQRAAAASPTIRELISDVYQLDAETSSLVNRLQTSERWETLYASYQTMDLRWRDVSYRLRAAAALDNRSSVIVDRIDTSFRNIDRQLGIAPPIDRIRLRDLMIVTLTYMDAIFDDLRLAPNAFGQSESLLREGRILREQLRQESYRIDRANYNEVVDRYTQYVLAWRAYAMKLYQLNDPHINLRLDSIRRQGDEVYASLRIPAASDRTQLMYAAQRMTASLVALEQEMVRYGVSRLPSDQQQFVSVVRTLIDRSRELENEVQRSGTSLAANRLFTEMDLSWFNGLRSMRAVDVRSGLPNLLVQVDAMFTELRNLLSVPGNQTLPIGLVDSVAAFEAAAEDLNIDIQRYKRLLQPAQYRDALAQNSDELYRLSQVLHDQVQQRSDVRLTKQTAQQLVAIWQQLTLQLNEVTQRGLSQSRTDRLYESYQQMQTQLAQIAAALLQ